MPLDDIDPESGLTLKQRLFCDIYLTCLNRTKAYREAGYAADSYGTARTESSNLLARPDIHSWIGQKMKERADRLSVSAERTLRELVIVAYSRVDHFRINRDTGLIEVKPGVPEEALGAVRSVKAVSKTTTGERDGRPVTETTWAGEFQLWDKLKALDTLCKHLGLVSAELPPLEVLMNRLPPEVAAILRKLMAIPPDQRPRPAPVTPPPLQQRC
jgi:phage terminase small subunit